MGRKSLLRPTKEKSPKSKATGKKAPVPRATEASAEAKRKEAILVAVGRSSAPVKATLKALGMPKSTFYKWSKAYKDKGLKGLEKGGPVSPDLWQRLADLEKEKKGPSKARKLSVEEIETMNSQQDDKTRGLLFRRFDDEQPPKGTGGAKAKTVKEPPPSPTCSTPPAEPRDKTITYALVGFGAVIAILLLASLSNSNNFYFKQKEQMVELWQGRFAPMGELFVASFSDPKMFKSVPAQKDVYSRKDAYRILCAYFVKRADEVLTTAETPDVKTVKSYLTSASRYAQSDVEKESIKKRLNSIEFLILMSKADLALTKGTPSEFDAARGYLTRAIPKATTGLQKDVLMKRLAAVEYALASHKIEKGEKQLAILYRDALDGNLQKAKEYNPENAKEIKQEMKKIQQWLDSFDKRQMDTSK